MAVRRISAVISGRVQGVGFRYFAKEAARDLGIVGFVRNTPGGDVEVLAEAEEGLLARFLGELRSGPRSARVDDIKVTWSEPTGQYDRFYVKG